MTIDLTSHLWKLRIAHIIGQWEYYGAYSRLSKLNSIFFMLAQKTQLIDRIKFGITQLPQK